MNRDYILLMLFDWSALILLFAVPFIYSVWKGNFKRCFWFTWIVWGVVIFIYGLFFPAIAILRAKVTGEPVDFDGFGFVLGIFIGWVPGLILAPLGCFFHDMFFGSK